MLNHTLKYCCCLLFIYFCDTKKITMAIAIKSIPVLKSKAAKAFVDRISGNTAKKSSVDFSKQANVASKILAKAKL
jgi:hypothetical protein